MLDGACSRATIGFRDHVIGAACLSVSFYVPVLLGVVRHHPSRAISHRDEWSVKPDRETECFRFLFPWVGGWVGEWMHMFRCHLHSFAVVVVNVTYFKCKQNTIGCSTGLQN